MSIEAKSGSSISHFQVCRARLANSPSVPRSLGTHSALTGTTSPGGALLRGCPPWLLFECPGLPPLILKGQAAWRRIVGLVATQRDPDYRIKDLAAVLLHYFEEEVHSLLLTPGFGHFIVDNDSASQVPVSFNWTKVRVVVPSDVPEVHFFLTRSLLHLKAPAVYAHIVSLVIDITFFAEPWFRSFFPSLSLAARLRLYDNYFQVPPLT